MVLQPRLETSRRESRRELFYLQICHGYPGLLFLLFWPEVGVTTTDDLRWDRSSSNRFNFRPAHVPDASRWQVGRPRRKQDSRSFGCGWTRARPPPLHHQKRLSSFMETGQHPPSRRSVVARPDDFAGALSTPPSLLGSCPTETARQHGDTGGRSSTPCRAAGSNDSSITSYLQEREKSLVECYPST